MRQFRFRKLTDGSVVLSEVHPNPSGLSNAKDTDVPILTMTAEEAAAVEHEDESVPAVPVAPVVPPASEVIPPAAEPVPPVADVVPDPLDPSQSEPVALVVEHATEPIPDVPPVQEG